ncbi:MAG: hypothetical protein GY860_06155 [Desulfobacteraceae bacterium]|nr:hypothetical protein [Desulfobacteraceae bacterium]
MREVLGVDAATIKLLPEKGHRDLVVASGLSDEYLGRGCIDDELSTHRNDW